MKRSLGLCGVLFALVSCSSGNEVAGSAGESVGESSSDLWLDNSGSVWPGGVVNVCFKANSLSAAARAQIQNALQKPGGWQQAANITFTGFGICSSDNPGQFTVRVERKDALGGNTIGLTSFDGFRVGKQSWVQFKGDPLVGGDWIVLHEFGHVLNFMHETSDTSCAQRTSGGTRLSPNDAAASVMDFNSGCNGGPTVISNNDRVGALSAYGPWTLPCPGGADSTCEMLAPVGRSDLDKLNTNNSPWSTTFAMNGYGKNFSQDVWVVIHAGSQTLKFTGPNALEMPTLDTHYDFTKFNVNNMGCIKYDTTAAQDSMAQLIQGGQSGCGATLGYGADGFPRYFSTHYNRDASLKNGADAWVSYPFDNQPITLTGTAGGSGVWIDLIQVKVKYGAIDIYSDASTGGNGVLALDKANLMPGTNTLSPPIWGAKKVVFTAHNASPTAVTNNRAIPPAAFESVMIGQP